MKIAAAGAAVTRAGDGNPLFTTHFKGKGSARPHRIIIRKVAWEGKNAKV
jgi:hypothetical protein